MTEPKRGAGGVVDDWRVFRIPAIPAAWLDLATLRARQRYARVFGGSAKPDLAVRPGMIEGDFQIERISGDWTLWKAVEREADGEVSHKIILLSGLLDDDVRALLGDRVETEGDQP